MVRYSESMLRGYCHIKFGPKKKRKISFEAFDDDFLEYSIPYKNEFLLKVGLVILLSSIGAITLDYLFS